MTKKPVKSKIEDRRVKVWTDERMMEEGPRMGRMRVVQVVRANGAENRQSSSGFETRVGRRTSTVRGQKQQYRSCREEQLVDTRGDGKKMFAKDR
ncbi:hypothetical protein MPTK1_5g06115 [Marchantia polymorpha subsp. ruderalis]